MAEAPPHRNHNGIEIPVPFLNTKLSVKGAAAILAIMVAGLGWWIYDQVKVRDAQMAALRQQIRMVECKIDLSIFLHSYPKGQVDWSAVPAGMYDCMPNFKAKQ